MEDYVCEDAYKQEILLVYIFFFPYTVPLLFFDTLQPYWKKQFENFHHPIHVCVA